MLRNVLLVTFAISYASTELPFVNRHNPRIIGGTAASIVQFPSMVSLQVELHGIVRFHLCGGSIISRLWVLTAAHCGIGRSPSSIVIRAGSTHEAKGGWLNNITQIIRHPDYNLGVRLSNDIALCKVSPEFVFNEMVLPALLIRAEDEVPYSTDGIVAGWGTTNSFTSGSSTLMQVAVPIMSNSECTRFYNPMRITDGMMCAGFKAGGKDACSGDSGGPLFAEGKLMGIVSWGDGCARPNAPGVYTRVAYYRTWIASITGF